MRTHGDASLFLPVLLPQHPSVHTDVQHEPCGILEFASSVLIGWGASSVGRALRSQRRGRGFNSRALHQTQARSFSGFLGEAYRPYLLPHARRSCLSFRSNNQSAGRDNWNCVTHLFNTYSSVGEPLLASGHSQLPGCEPAICRLERCVRGSGPHGWFHILQGKFKQDGACRHLVHHPFNYCPFRQTAPGHIWSATLDS
jgi:hypothetical protein